MSRHLKISLWLLWLLAVVWPWTGLPWRGLSIPAGALLLILGLALSFSRRWQDRARAAADGLDAVDPGRAAWPLAGLFFVWLASLKLCQYASFQSHYGDLGQDANICWNTLQGLPFFDSLTGTNFLGDHFEPVLAVCALAFKVWPSPAALLLIQCLALAAAVVPLIGLARRASRRNALVLAAALLFMLNPFLHLVSEFDFHPEALFIPAAFWALLFWEQGRLWPAALVVLPCLAFKEDVPLALAAFGVYAGLWGDSPRRRRAGWVLAAFALAAFAVIVLKVIPHFAGSRVSVHHDRYVSLGTSAGEMIRNILLHPWVVPLRLLRPGVVGAWAALLGSAAFLPLAAPAALVPVLGACLHHLLSDYRSQYSLVSQYSAQTLPFLFYAALKGLTLCEDRVWQKRGRLAAGFVFLCAVLAAFQPFYTGPFKWRNVLEAAALVRQVPDGASLAADGGRGLGREDLLPHLALRTGLSQFDAARPFQEPSARYVLLSPDRSAAYAAALAKTGRYRRIGSGDGLELWSRQEEHGQVAAGDDAPALPGPRR
ncbi:MAG: DUF2079 domain-containing protein [Elusimicrobia bacterium]|nr:DUF2079 domain-containing protein [Elusimicrobiota bacterium]